RYGAEEWDLVFDNWMANLAGSLTGPIFDAGRRKAEIERTRAMAAERLAAYKETVAVAVREVEDALVRETKQRGYLDALRAQLAAAQASYNEALDRYRKGLNDYLPVLSALTAVQILERTLVQAEHDLLVYRVQLHLALGGAWMQQKVIATEE
ncbi:MAG TPA: TolC family protein, partial [Candidatus Hydrogenedentes bacterium]|nr:TolC family protein [Candidatus Hydrogenedentota bacterium]